jgi:hypothetical protein
MATKTYAFRRDDASFPNVALPVRTRIEGTNFMLHGLAFDSVTTQQCFFPWHAVDYGSGNLTVTIKWLANIAITGSVTFGAAIACLKDTSQDATTKAFTTEVTTTVAHAGTTGRRLQTAQIVVNQLDSLAPGDMVWVRLRRITDATDTMVGNAVVTGLTLSYSDT